MSSRSEGFTIDLRRLDVLRELEQRGTVAATAAALHLTPSAVSQQLAGLARDVGVPLLERRGRGVLLTGQARVLLEHAAAVREQLERARADLRAFGEGALGAIRIGSLSTGIAALVAPALERLGRSRPGLALQVAEYEPDEAVARLDAGELDIAVLAEFSGAPARADGRYHRLTLLTDVMDVVLRADHPRVAPDGVRLADLADEPFVGADASDTCQQIAFAVCAAAGFNPQVRHRGREWDSVASLVAAGAGVALVPRSAYPLRPTGLVCCPVIGAPASRVLFALTRAGTEGDPGVALVLEELLASADTARLAQADRLAEAG